MTELNELALNLYHVPGGRVNPALGHRSTNFQTPCLWSKWHSSIYVYSSTSTWGHLSSFTTRTRFVRSSFSEIKNNLTSCSFHHAAVDGGKVCFDSSYYFDIINDVYKTCSVFIFINSNDVKPWIHRGPLDNVIEIRAVLWISVVNITIEDKTYIVVSIMYVCKLEMKKHWRIYDPFLASHSFPLLWYAKRGQVSFCPWM